MNNSDLSSIRERLLAVQTEFQADAETVPRGWDLPRSPSLPLLGHQEVGRGTTHQVDMAQALRQRSPQGSRPPTPEELAATAAPIPGNINNCLRRLHEEAEKINDLYRQQELAIQKFQSTAKGLDVILLRQGAGQAFQREQFVHLRQAALTKVIQDKAGCYVLTAVDIDLNRDQQQAFQDAAEIRAYAGRGQGGRVWHGFSLGRHWWRSPLARLADLWHTWVDALEYRTRVTPLDILVWCGGGVIGRVALDLALAATPGLWNWVVAITIGAVALGLYRMLFAPRPDVSFIARVLLALIGLAIGGQI